MSSRRALGYHGRDFVLLGCTTVSKNSINLPVDAFMEKIIAPSAPAAIGPYSHAVRTGNLLFCSGQIPLDPSSMEITGDSVEAQTKQVFANITHVLASQGLGLGHVVKALVFLKDMNDFAAMNAVYGEAFGDHKPARSAVEVARLPKDVFVEIEVIAEFPS